MTKRYINCWFCLVAFVIATATGIAQTNKLQLENKVQVVGGSTGTEFWIAIPPNDFPQQPTTNLDVQIASAYDTDVEVYDAAGDQTRRYKIAANGIKTLTDTKGETNWTWEVRESEQVVRKGIRLRAKQPISVYVLNGKYVSSDGFLAIPTSAFGKKYIATTYYDFREIYAWPAGFVIVAKDNGTVVNIKLRGTGKGYGKTAQGKEIGDEWQVSLEAGDCYAVYGDAASRGVFDITGTEVTSNNPIGMISAHWRTTMPNLLSNGNGRNHMVEMTPPVDTWGKRYVTVEYNRASTGAGKGDVFRVIGSQDNTSWTLKFYDKVTHKLLGQSGGKLAKAGDFADLAQATAPTVLTYGYSVWEADKPIFVMQYSCSANFDGDQLHDPFMINVVPEEQFITTTLFQSPTHPKFTTHKLNLIVWADTADPDYIDNLKSLEIDGKAVWNHPEAAAPTLLFNHMGNNLHWTTITFGQSATAHRIKSNGKAKFGGYIYGYGDVDAYGWPAASGFRPTTSFDTMPPLLKYTENCGVFEFEATELRNIPDPPVIPPHDSDQVETGVAVIDSVIGEGSYNYKLELITADMPFPSPSEGSFKRFNFRWSVVDKTKDAYCVFYVEDWAGNITLDTIQYFAPKLVFEPPVLNFGKIRLGTKKQLDLKITNVTGDTVSMEKSRIFSGAYFTIVSGGLPPTILLADGQSITIRIEYDGKRETTNLLTDIDFDTLEVSTKCAPFKIRLEGVAAIPRIVVEDYHAGIVSIGERVCKSGGLRVQNPGSDTLVITGMTGFGGTNFSVSNPTTPPLPISIAPKGEVFITEICYQRSDVGSDSIDVNFANNGDGPDSVSTWTGETQTPGPRITGYDWMKRRVNTRHTALVQVRNDGNQPLTVQGISFADGSRYFPAGSNDGNFVFKINGIMQNGMPVTEAILQNGASVDALVEFRPAARQVYSEPIRPVWKESDVTLVTALLQGEGILPEFQSEGAALTCLETPEGVPAVRNLVITNNGNMDLTCTVAFAAGTDPQWSWQTPPTNPIIVPFAAGTNSVSIPVVFTRAAGNNGGSTLTVDITHDAVPGNGTDSTITGPVSATETFTVASCSGPDIVVTNIDYGRNRANCDTPLLEFTITNTGGGTTNLEIRDLQIVDADAGNFQIVNMLDGNGAPATLPLRIAPLQTFRVQVRFTPTDPSAAPLADRTYNARVHVLNYEEGRPAELKPDVYVQLTGVGYVIPHTFALSHNRTGTVNPGIDPEITFTVTGHSNDWNNAQLTSFTADVIYETKAYAYTPNSISRGPIPGDWTISEPVRTDIDGVRSRLRFTANGTTPISADGAMFSFKGTLLLGPNFDQQQDLVVDLLRPCLINTTTGSTTSIVNCALSKRVVDIGKTQAGIRPPAPNPVNSDVAVIEFGVGYRANAVLDIVDASGSVVATLVNQQLSEGEYNASFPVNTIGNGAYFVRLTFGDFTDTKPLVIAR